MLNFKITLTAISITLCLLLQACGNEKASEQKNEVLEVRDVIKMGGAANTIDVKDGVRYKFLEDGASRFKVDNGSGALTVDVLPHYENDVPIVSKFNT